MEMAKFDLGACAEKLAAADKRAADLLADNKALIDQLGELRQAQVALQNEKIALYVELDTATRAVAKLTTEVQSLEALREETEMLKEVIRTGNSVAASATTIAPTTTTPVSLPPQPPSPPISVKDATIQASETVSHVASSTEPEVFNNNTSNEINSLPIPNPLADEVEALKREIQLTRQALSEERHRTELLAMELECIPDYIQLYHNERKLLINKVTADAATPAANSSGNPIKLTDLSHIPAPKLPRAVKNVLGIDRNVACGPCADCSSRVFVL
ncbi:hypothetical protein BDR26DRAFT_859762 [Obelidium mucronatum]|nr:hypothetical protein BDR26DRAFT_859762 [Obelidium mucronatum]